MENRTSSDVLNSTSDVRLPSGLEVESAWTAVPSSIGVQSVSDDHLLSDSHDGGMKDRLYHMKQRATEPLSSLQHNVSWRMSGVKRGLSMRMVSLKSTARDGMSKIRSGADAQVSRIQSELRANPGKWAGIAAGAGLGIGIIGRIMRHRTRNANLPSLVIIDSI